jgi:hypothetical protein
MTPDTPQTGTGARKLVTTEFVRKPSRDAVYIGSDADDETGTGALEAAIEAGMNAAYEVPGQPGLDDRPHVERGITAAVRAAAPLIEREALLRAAEAILADPPERINRDWYAQWLCDRAEAVSPHGA